jgi:uncharacterized protein
MNTVATMPLDPTTDAACLIMAGGEGRRLSPDKPLLHVDGRPIIARVADVVTPIFSEVLLVTNTPEKYDFLGLAHVPDEEPGHGPLMGIYSGLGAIRADHAFVCAADMPFLEPDIIRAELDELGDHDMVIPYPDDLPEFLHGVYRTRCLPAIRTQLDEKRYKIDLLRQILDVHVLTDAWFEERGLEELARKAFANINTVGDYRTWTDEDPFGPIPPSILERIRTLLIEDESRFQREHGQTTYSSLWSHSSRVAAIAHTIAASEGVDTTAAVLACLLHDTGKFREGRYHTDERPEEEAAAALAAEILENTSHASLVPDISSAILSLYRDDARPDPLGAVVHDADRIDKLGYAGVAQFFTKNALRGRFLDDDLLLGASIELTYALHAERTLKTRTGRELAAPRADRVRRYFDGLIEEWQELGLGSFRIENVEVETIPLVLVVPATCSCGGRHEVRTDIQEGVKCRSAVIEYVCPSCSDTRELSFCLPVLSSLLDP